MRDNSGSALLFLKKNADFCVSTAILIALVVTFSIIHYGLNIEFTYSITDYYGVLVGTIVAMIGVSITGYIFLIEYFRGMKEERPIYVDVSDKVQNKIYGRLSRLLIFGILLALLFVAIMALIKNDRMENSEIQLWARLLLLYFSLIFLYRSVRIDLKMMDIKTQIREEISKNKDEAYRDICDNTDLIIRLNPNEYEEIINSPEFIKDIGRGSTKNVIKFIRGRDTDNVRIEYDGMKCRNNSAIIGYRDNRDEYDVENIINIFNDVEKLLCRILNINESSVPEHISIKILLSDNNAQFMETGISGDIEDYYKMIRKFRDYYILQNDIDNRKKKAEKKIEKFTGKVPSYNYSDGDCSKIAKWFFDYDDVEKDTDLQPGTTGKRDELEKITPYVLLLRYELSKKLYRKNISNISLTSYDFSYANMSDTSLRDSYLFGSSFFNADMRSSDLSGSNLRYCDFKHARCIGTVMKKCDLHNSSFADSILNGSVLTGSVISDCLFPEISMSNCDMRETVIVDSKFDDCNISNSNLQDTSMNYSRFNRCTLINDNIKHTKFSNALITLCSFNGALITGSSINKSSLIKSTFSSTNMTDSEMTSLLILMSNFDNSELRNINFTESQMIGSTFRSSNLNNSHFNKSSIGSYGVSLNEFREDDLLSKIERYKNEMKEKGLDGFIRRIPFTNDNEASISSFEHSNLSNSSFVESDISVTDISYSLLIGSTFNKTKISHSSLRSTDMSNMTIIDCCIEDCDMTNASIANTSMTNVMIDDCCMNSCDLTNAAISDAKLKNVDLSGSNLTGTRLIYCSLNDMVIDSDIFKDAVLFDVMLKGCRDQYGNAIPDQERVDGKKLMELLKGRIDINGGEN